MRVICKRFFITEKFGNVSEGRVLDVSDAYGKHLIEYGFVDRVKSTNPAEEAKFEEKRSDFRSPVASQKEPGSSSQADQALKTKTLKPSRFGAKPPKKDTSRS